MTDDLQFRFANQADVPWLARMNKQLIRDENHRNKMAVPELEQRMADFLRADYSAVIVTCARHDIGYALYRPDEYGIYLRQLFIKSDMRRKGIGRRVIEWLKNNPWKGCKRIRTDVLVGNPSAIDFWKAVGFADYCITMEMENEQSVESVNCFSALRICCPAGKLT